MRELQHHVAPVRSDDVRVVAVEAEGAFAHADGFDVKRDEHAIPDSEITRLYTSGKRDYQALQRMLTLEALPEGWRDYFQERLDRSR